MDSPPAIDVPSSEGGLTDLDRIVTEYLLAEERCAAPVREILLEQHPDLADELRAFFEDHDRLASYCDAATLADLPRPDGSELPAAALPRFGAIGPYDLLDEIARGGMGIVYRASHRQLNRIVALKMILTGQLARGDEIERFRAEAEAAAGLQHAGIVPIHEIGEEGGIHYYTMPYVEGQSLADRLRRGPLAAPEAARLMRQVAEAVAYAHERRVIHRDLKPANILIDLSGKPRIADFGLAKSLDAGRQLTATGQVLGTLQYMSPEQAAAKHDSVAETADIYALGAILYATITGRPPFQATSHVDLLLQVLEQEPPPPRKLDQRIPRELEAICLRCLEKDPARRYRSAADLLDDLDRFLTDEPVAAARGGWRGLLRRWVRRQPMLAAHLGSLALIESLRQTKYMFGADVGYSGWNYHLTFSLLMAVWIVGCFGFQWLLSRPQTTEIARFVWSTADTLLVALCLLYARAPNELLFATFPLLVVTSGIYFRVRLVVYTTLHCIAAPVLLLVLRPQPAPPAHYVAIFVAVLAAIGMIVGYHVRRLRIMSQYYERFQ